MAPSSNYALGAAIADQQRGDMVAAARAELGTGIETYVLPGTIADAMEDADATFERGLRWLIAGMRESNQGKHP